MDYLLKNALIDTTIMVSAILFLFLAFRFLAKNVAADSIVGCSKRWVKKLTFFSVASIIFFYLKWIRLISAQLPIDEHRCLSSQKTPDKVF